MIFDSYQEQSYLWDPDLESLVAPVVDAFKVHAKTFASGHFQRVSDVRLHFFSMLPYLFVKFRGYKTITKFFPHEIADLTTALDCMTSHKSPIKQTLRWPLRYILLLWLSLVCMIPFDLEQFDEVGKEGQTASKVEGVGKHYLGKAGLDREGSALLLSKFYMRKDTASRFPDFLKWATETVGSTVDPFPATGLLRVLCEVTKLGSAEQVQTCKEQLLQVVTALGGNQSLMNNTVIRQLRTKLIARVAIRLLPGKTRRLRAKGQVLASEGAFGGGAAPDEDDIDVPDEAESVLEDLFKSLRDKDTVVRYSAAKGVARIAERLPADFAEQVLDQVLHLFSIHSAGIASIYDLPSIAEATWHGACLACAEMARRGLIPDERLSELVEWLYKALLFDIRKGAHSIGSNVRDAASYVLWSLARAQGVSALQPHAVDLARKLVTVSLFDREVHIRRAASAAFQEYVGRTSLFPHGIDVLRETDFYAVGIRRSAFTIAAPEVAEHEEYRGCLIDHLLAVTLRHWDSAMREIGAQSLRCICELDLVKLGPDVAKRAAQLLVIPDDSDVHGGLLALTELAAAFRSSPHRDQLEPERRKIFAALSTVPLTTIQSSRQELIAAAACSLIASGISFAETQHGHTTVPHWRQVVDSGLKHRTAAVQEAAASALAAVSRLVDCSAVVRRLIREFEGQTAPMQQSLARVLEIPAEFVRDLVDALLDGLTDYTSDERGDVGSWVRISCVKSLTSFSQTLFSRASSLLDLARYLPPEKYDDAIAGILKQGVERLDNVRQIAGDSFLALLLLPPPVVLDSARWKVREEVRIKELFLSEQESVGWNVGSWLFPRAVQLLDIQWYRHQILAGIILSASTKTDSTQRPVTSALVGWALTIPITTSDPDRYDLRGLAQDLLGQALQNTSLNNVVVPVLQTINVLLEADVFEKLPQDPEGLQTLRSLLSLVSKNASRLKNPQRISMSMRCLVNLLPISELQRECISQLSTYLGHQYPRVRADTAEYLYLVLSSKDTGLETDNVEEILLETEWSSQVPTLVEDAAHRCVELLSAAKAA
ncbi:hypothetical protein GSI_15229 [Ganoderma sinense ZZ0214-1]|uniref:Uncharacterized protein n=1 Tax=Ganoderma sinense ZZ0214-1 TaxID=1077348 RepID=A0A2G8RM10_9APHY|nr:hypothetical protein GSI_15229 [Ganoderma sinense ZZ0214-1]